MKNHMKDVAKLLGVELDEEFEVVNVDSDINKYFAKITINGIEVRDEKRFRYTTTMENFLLTQLLVGRNYGIKRIPYKPKYGELYWSIDQYGNVMKHTWADELLDCIFYKIGNCYRSEEEACKHIEEWKEIYKLFDKVLNVK